jgi:hypothetical protein
MKVHRRNPEGLWSWSILDDRLGGYNRVAREKSQFYDVKD